MNRKTLLSLACAGASLIAMQAAAQEASVVDEIVVTGTKASLGRALDVKRKAMGVVDSIAAEDIGKMPDQNVAESLQRVPGVSIDRAQGEGRFITVRGFGPEFNTVLLNGRVLATDNDGREFSFDILPSELISGADVYKTSSAELQDGGIGSTVNIKTARPTDRAGSFIAGSLAAKYDSGSGKYTPSGSILASKSNADRSFGVLASFVYDKRKSRVKRFSTDGWVVNQDLDFNKDGVVDLAGVAVDRGAGQAVDTSTRERIGGTFAVDWRASDSVNVKLDGLYSQYKMDSVTNAMGYFSDPADIISATANANRTLTHYVRSNTGSLATDNTISALPPRDARTFQIAGNVEWKPGEDTTITTDLAWSRATNHGRDGVPVIVIGSRNTGRNPTWDLQSDQPTPAYSNVNSTTDVSTARGHFARLSGDNISDDVVQFKLDGEQRFDGTLKAIRAGVTGSRREKITKAYETPGGILCGFCGYAVTLPANLTQVFNSGGGSFLGSRNLPTQWLSFDPKQLLAYYTTDAAIAQANGPASFRAALAANGNSYNGVLNPQASGSVREETVAAYVQSDFEGQVGDKPWSVQAGVRWTHTKLLAKGSSQKLLSLSTIPGDATFLNYELSTPVPVEATNKYGYFLPSVSARLNLTDQVVLRAAGSRTLTRPTLTSLGLNESYNLRPPASFFVSGGNPDLKPYLAWNGDIGLDYYINASSYMSVAGFYKKVDNFVSLVTQPKQILGRNFLDTRPTNAQSADVYGLEAAAQVTFDFLPAPFDGFGMSANYTKVESSVSFDPSLSAQVFNVEGLSDSANLVVFYEKGPLQLRGAYNWRAKFLRRTFGSEGNPENVNGYGQFDMSGSWAIRKNFSFFVEGVNLFNKKTRSYSAYEERLLTLEESGRRVMFGARASF
jgi:iron complex outermembrane receptor protein